MTKKKLSKKFLVPKIGDRHDVDGTICEVRFTNQMIGFLFPLVDDPEDYNAKRCLCYGKVYEDGRVVKL